VVKNPFARPEYLERVRRIQEAMAEQSLDLLILTSPDNVYYASAYMTRAITAHQYLAIPADGAPLFTTRRRDIGNFYGIADLTPIGDHATYEDDDDAKPPLQVFLDLIRKHGLRTRRIGIEKKSLYLLVDHYEQLAAVFDQSVFVDASMLVENLRIIKSSTEIDCHRQAGRIVVAGVDAAIAASRPGATDSHVAAVTAAALIEAGSEWCATWPVIRFGPQSGRAHSSWQGVEITAGQPTTIETAGVTLRYHTPLYATVIHDASPEQRALAETVRLAAAAGIAEIRAGITAGAVYRAVEDVINDRGHADYLVGRLGYSVGTGFPPNWVQRLGIDVVRNSPKVLRAGMVFHMVTVLMRQNEFSIGHSSSVAVTEGGSEVLTVGAPSGPLLL
jgi:Xaa-Pro dipeptidase